MQIVFSQNGYPIGTIPLSGEPCYWAVKLKDPDVWLCERDVVDAPSSTWVTQEHEPGGLRYPIDQISTRRNLDWTLDIVSTGDWRRITELWLFCPMSPTSPAGNTVRLPITTPGTAFQLHVATLESTLAVSARTLQAQIIGRVLDGETGACECFVYDYALQALVLERHPITGAPGPWRTHIGLPGRPAMGAWRPNLPGQPSIAPLHRLNLPVVGIFLPGQEEVA